MSLVLEALRRVEKADPKAGSVGVAVASYRPSRNRRGMVLPLLLGLGTGLILLFGLPAPEPVGGNAPASGVAADRATQAPLTRARAALPPMKLAAPVAQPREIRPSTDSTAPAAGRGQRVSAAVLEIGTPPLVLQAISERDSHPIAIINDQLVKEGDLLGRVRVLSIGPDFVDVLLENGKKETVRFAPPPPPEPSPTSDRR